MRDVLHPGGPADTLTRIQDTLTRELRAAGALPPPIQVVPVAEIQREGGHGAKLKLYRLIGNTSLCSSQRRRVRSRSTWVP